jgi:hypothetical protein
MQKFVQPLSALPTTFRNSSIGRSAHPKMPGCISQIWKKLQTAHAVRADIFFFRIEDILSQKSRTYVVIVYLCNDEFLG